MKKKKRKRYENNLGFTAMHLTLFLISINMNFLLFFFFSNFHQESVKNVTAIILYSTY